MADASLTVSLLTPEQVMIDGPAERVIVPLHDGEAGILAGHAPMVARLGAGIARILHEGKTTPAFVSGGFVQVSGSTVTILTDDARPPEELDRAESLATLEAVLAESAVGEKAQDARARKLALARSRARITKGT